MYRDIPEELRTLVEPIVAEHGLELVDLERTHGAGALGLCITVDTLVGDGRVSVESCAALSREIESQLDALDAIPVRYRLEVSSPGLDRRLTREKDFVAATGSEVRVETRRPLDGRRRFRGHLLRFAEGIATLDVDGQEFSIPFVEVARATRLYRFTREDYARGR